MNQEQDKLRAALRPHVASHLVVGGHELVLGAGEMILWEQALPKLLDGRFDPPWVRDIANALGATEDAIRQLFKKTCAHLSAGPRSLTRRLVSAGRSSQST